jgi:seryl-tRNA synthetase
MFDIRWIRDNPDLFDEGLKRRGLEPIAAEIIKLDEARRSHVKTLQDMQNRRNAASKEIGNAKASGDEERAAALIAEVAEIKSTLQKNEEEERVLTERLETALSEIPNLPLDDVPVGADETGNIIHHTEGERPQFSFAPKEHFELGETLGLMDFETAARLSGARFVILKGALARLERALASFMLDMHTTEFGYTEIQPPVMVRDHALYGTGQLPKFADDLFRTNNDMWLIPTAEVPLTNLAREAVTEEARLPKRVTAWTPCFRAEAGSAGRDTRGMIRQHQFNKVELVSLTTEDQSLDELERMRTCAEEVLKRLGLHYQVLVLCTGDMGFSARKTYDLEVWLPGQNMFREISSCSVCGDFQARRMNARYKPVDGGSPRFIHTLNGSGLAVGRTLVAILENFQREDCSILIPDILQPYMGGMSVITGGE